VRTTCGITNKESGDNKKEVKYKLQQLQVKKLLINKQLLKLLMSTLLLLQKMLKDKVKIILLMRITILWIVIHVLWNKLLLNLY